MTLPMVCRASERSKPVSTDSEPTADQTKTWAEMRVKHLEMLQAVISRMAGNSANVKTYCMAIAAAIIGLAATTQKPQVLWYAIPLVILLGILDGCYLRLERAFRDQFDSVRRADDAEKPDFAISPSWSAGHGIMSGFWSWSVWLFYLPIVAVFVGIAMVMT